jgi:fumarate reductase subunit D
MALVGGETMKKEEPKPNNKNKDKNVSWIGFGAIVLACIIVVFAIVLHLRDIPFGPYDPGDIVMMLLLLSFVALVIERVTEVVMIVLRDAGEKNRLDKVDELKKQLKESGSCEGDLPDAETNLRSYKAATKIYSISLLFAFEDAKKYIQCHRYDYHRCVAWRWF